MPMPELGVASNHTSMCIPLVPTLYHALAPGPSVRQVSPAWNASNRLDPPAEVVEPTIAGGFDCVTTGGKGAVMFNGAMTGGSGAGGFGADNAIGGSGVATGATDNDITGGSGAGAETTGGGGT